MIVIDACVAVKWFLGEADSEEALTLLEDNAGAISVPALFAVEVAAALVRNGNIHKHATDAMRESLYSFSELMAGERLATVDTTPAALLAASELALELGHPLKDCLYLALAMQLECPLATADHRFALKARTAWSEVRLLAA